ncbi:MAG: threonylcarbamoyl-AMP synthase [Clostridia bacterium]|nr:threonylcarbamoyl-AMP synthase [Clostridia bacterium]
MKTKLLRTRPADIAEAGGLLAAGQVVAIPTETVYGLAANALDGDAVLRIFEAKGRPQDNPLIVHISALEQLEDLAEELSPAVYQMAEHFWPGPLTMVVKKKAVIPDRTSAGLDTVGIRMPSHPVARAIIDAAGVPLAAPSANTSGKPSPTTARDVLDDMNGKIPAIVDGGACSVGVESTVVDMTGDWPQILRPGAITEEMIAEAMGAASTDRATLEGLSDDAKVRSPGMKYRHYAPKAPVILYEGSPWDTFCGILEDMNQPWTGVICFEEFLPAIKESKSRLVYSLGYSWDHAEHARRLFSLLRRFDRTQAKRILVQCPRTVGANAGTVNRLRKAAGFRSVDCKKGRRVIGVTGRSGSGKSLLSQQLQAVGAQVLDADKVYAQLLKTDNPMTRMLCHHFPGVWKEGVLDRKKLADIVFSDPKALETLNFITHSQVKAQMHHTVEHSDSKLIVLDVPLLFESGIDQLCDLTLAVLADREGSLARIMKRDGIDRPRAEARLNSQPHDDFYRARADLLLHNTGTLAQFEEKVDTFVKKYCK